MSTLTQQWGAKTQKTPKTSNKSKSHHSDDDENEGADVRRQIFQAESNDDEEQSDLEYDLNEEQLEELTQLYTQGEIDDSDDEGHRDVAQFNYSHDLTQESQEDEDEDIDHEKISDGEEEKEGSQIFYSSSDSAQIGLRETQITSRLVTNECDPPAKKQKLEDTQDTFYHTDFSGICRPFKINEAYQHKNEKNSFVKKLIFLIKDLKWVRMKKVAVCGVYRQLKYTFIEDEVKDIQKNNYVLLQYSCDVPLSLLGERLNDPPKEIFETNIFYMDNKKTVDDHLKNKGERPKSHGFEISYSRKVMKRQCITDTNKPKVLDIFAGAGGMSQGFIKAGFESCWAVEKNPAAAATFRRNHNRNVHIYNECVRTWFKKGFSKANRFGGKNDEANNDLSLFCIEIINHFRPKTVSIENVTGMAHPKNKHYLQRIMAELVEMNYSVRLQIIDSQRYGDPQSRPRVFVVAARSELVKSKPPMITHGDEGNLPIKSVSDALSDLCNIPPVDGDGRVSCGTLFTYNHSLDATKIKSEVYQLQADKPAPAIRRKGNLRHYSEDRCLTVREMARLFSFDDSFEFCGKLSEQIDQIGNAVPVKLATAVASAIMSFHHTM